VRGSLAPEPFGFVIPQQKINNPLSVGHLFSGGRGGTRTLKPYRQRILSPQRIPIPPLARVGIEVPAFVISGNEITFSFGSIPPFNFAKYC
jgi:hypothetical protein